MNNQDQWDYYSHFSPGRFKTFANATTSSTGTIIHYLQPDRVEGEMKKLILKTNSLIVNTDLKELEKHPITTATYFHNRFLEIHPFEDGNGRIARIITNQIFLKNDFPPIFLKSVNRDEYLKLFDVSTSDDIDKMRDFFGKLLLQSLEMKKQMIESSLTISKLNKLEKGMGL
jgi:Fic family protein